MYWNPNTPQCDQDKIKTAPAPPDCPAKSGAWGSGAWGSGVWGSGVWGSGVWGKVFGGLGLALVALLAGVAQHADDIARPLLRSVDDLGRGASHVSDEWGGGVLRSGDDFGHGWSQQADQFPHWTAPVDDAAGSAHLVNETSVVPVSEPTSAEEVVSRLNGYYEVGAEVATEADQYVVEQGVQQLSDEDDLR